MANKLQKLLYYLSAESPILMILAVIWLKEKSIWTKPIVLSWKVPMILAIHSVDDNGLQYELIDSN